MSTRVCRTEDRKQPPHGTFQPLIPLCFQPWTLLITGCVRWNIVTAGQGVGLLYDNWASWAKDEADPLRIILNDNFTVSAGPSRLLIIKILRLSWMYGVNLKMGQNCTRTLIRLQLNCEPEVNLLLLKTPMWFCRKMFRTAYVFC